MSQTSLHRAADAAGYALAWDCSEDAAAGLMSRVLARIARLFG